MYMYMLSPDFTNLDECYKDKLLNDVIPFWMKYSLDEEYGGFISQLDRDGIPYGKDKAIWIQGRGTWMFAKLYNDKVCLTTSLLLEKCVEYAFEGGK